LSYLVSWIIKRDSSQGEGGGIALDAEVIPPSLRSYVKKNSANEFPWNEVLCIHGSLDSAFYGKGRERYSLSSFYELFSVLPTFVKNLYKWLSSSITPAADYSITGVILSTFVTPFGSTAYLWPTSRSLRVPIPRLEMFYVLAFTALCTKCKWET